LDDYILVEDFFLSKKLFPVGRDYAMISRFIPPIDLELIFPIERKDGKTIKMKPTVITSFYREIGVITFCLNMVCEEIGVDDLIYIKSLKWNSVKDCPNSPKIKVIINGKNRGEWYFREIFKMLYNEIFENRLKIGTESKSILDLIEIRDKKIGDHIFHGQRNDLLFGLLIGDEGYTIDKAKMITKYLSNPDICMWYRDYSKYFFAPTTILGFFSKEYPKRNKKAFAKVYAKRYDNFEPLCKYINLVSDIATLSDGVALPGEVTLVRYSILQEIDMKIRDQFEEGKMSFRNLLTLKKEITTRLANIELLAKDVLWINLPYPSSEMFGYSKIKMNIQERLGYIDGHIRDKYNARIQYSWLSLTIILLVLTLIIGVFTILD